MAVVIQSCSVVVTNAALGGASCSAGRRYTAGARTLQVAAHDWQRNARHAATAAGPDATPHSRRRPSPIVSRALTLLLEDVRRQKCGAAKNPRAGAAECSNSRAIPAAVRRAVWARDGGRCAFVGTHGRCSETAFLEYHHRQPFAVGGQATVEDIELRCRAHNVYEAQLFFTVTWRGRLMSTRSGTSCLSWESTA
jgi:hypothetical protein